MTLSDRDIIAAIKSGRIVVKPKPNFDEQLGSCSLDFHLANTFRVFEHTKYPYYDLKKTYTTEKFMREVKLRPGEPFIMQPGDYVLASTQENLELADDIMGRLEGRSSLGRLGIIIHGTASIFDAGWRGVITMELGNLGVLPVTLYPGMRICAMAFEELSSPSDRPYWKKHRAKYVSANEPEPSKLAQEFQTSSHTSFKSKK